MNKRVLSLIACVLSVSIIAGCSKSSETSTKKAKKVKTESKVSTSSEETTETTEKPVTDESSSDTSATTVDQVKDPSVSDPSLTGPSASDPSTSDPSASDPNTPLEIKDMTFLSYYAGTEIDDDNEIKEEIGKKTGVRLQERYSSFQSVEAVEEMIANGSLPDLIEVGNAAEKLYQSNSLVAWDDYLADPAYSNLRNLYSDKQWEHFRQEDGHIYWADVYGINGESKEKYHDDEAFWIQVRVLEWAGYPKIETLDDYFDLLERYYAEHKENEDGTKIIPYTIMREDWRSFCIDTPPQFLGGYPKDGAVNVNAMDPDHPVIEDYNTSAIAKEYLQKLNEVYGKGLIDSDFSEMDYDHYIEKISTGAVLGFFDARWDFRYAVDSTFKDKGYDELGYDYVPLALTTKSGMSNYYHSYDRVINYQSGIAVTTQCSDPALAFSFLNRCLDQDVHDLRFWGIKGVDYKVDDEGMYYRTPEMRIKWEDPYYKYSHVCSYSLLPQYRGTSKDGKNAMMPEEQDSEFFTTLSWPLRKCFDAYGYTSYLDFLHSEVTENGVWFPMWTYSNSLDSRTPGGAAHIRIGECKDEWLPKIIMSKNFDSAWKQYTEAYEACKPSIFLKDMQKELDRRVIEG